MPAAGNAAGGLRGEAKKVRLRATDGGRSRGGCLGVQQKAANGGDGGGGSEAEGVRSKAREARSCHG